MEHPFPSSVPSLSRLAIDERTLLSGRFWAELRTFLAVAKAKSLSRAAEDLGLSRMTAAREIRRLQDAIGAQLVTFAKTGATLTPTGEKLARALQRVDQEIFAMTSDLRGEGSLAEGTVRLSVTDGIGIMFIVPMLHRLVEKYPRIRLDIVATQNYFSLLENRTDLMVGFAEERYEALTSIRRGTLHLMPFVSRPYVEKYGLPTRENISEHLFVDSAQYSAKTDLWAPWRSLVKDGRIAFTTDSSMTYGMLVKAGLGIGLLPSVHVMNSSAVSPDLGCNIALPLYVTAVSERLQSRPVRIVFDFVSSVLGEGNSWLSREFTVIPGDPTFVASYHMLLNS
jgi:DNA-binding transcriptional LysR family regulator